LSGNRIQETGQQHLRRHIELAEKRGLPARKRICVIMFIDIVGYSTFASRTTDSKALELVRRFENAARELISDYGGRVVMTAGDAVMACWNRKEMLGRAATCALLIRQRLNRENRSHPRAEKIRIRVGIHCGQVLELQDGDIIGNAVNLSARLQTAAKPGEVLISSVAAEMGKACQDMPASDKVGYMRLKGFDQAVEVAHLGKSGKPQCLKPITDSLASPFQLKNWGWGSYAFVVAGLLFGLGMTMTSASAEFPQPKLTALGLFVLFLGWAILWASYRPRTISFLHPVFRVSGMLFWGLVVIFAGGYCGCWPG
jgi:class 3 adenylate cyclase